MYLDHQLVRPGRKLCCPVSKILLWNVMNRYGFEQSRKGRGKTPNNKTPNNKTPNICLLYLDYSNRIVIQRVPNSLWFLTKGQKYEY